MNRRRIRLTETARNHIRREQHWWLKNRASRSLFADELQAAFKIVELLPGIGSLYEHTGTPGLRRMYLPKITCHLYYTFSDEEVIVRALWGA